MYKRVIISCIILAAAGCSEEPTGPGDQLPPFITWLSPAGDTLIITDTVTVEFAAVDDGGVVSRVEVYVSNALNATVTAKPFRALLDFSALPGDSTYDVYAFAYDPAGKARKTAATYKFTKRVSPLVSWNSPTNDTTVTSDSPRVIFDVIDPRGTLESVNIYLAGVLHQTLSSPPYDTVYLDLTAYGNNRSREVYATAVDTSGAVKSTTDILSLYKETPPDTATWTLLAPGVSPAARYEHSFSLDAANQRAVLFGGFSTTLFQKFNDAWFFNFTTNTWDSLEVTGSLPERRKHHGAGVFSNTLLIFGGDGGTGFPDTVLQDYYFLDLGTSAWGLGGFFTIGFAGMTNASLNNEVYSYGGAVDLDQNGTYDDALDLVLRFSASGWDTITAPSSQYPGHRYFAAMAEDVEGNRLFLYGGSDTSDVPNDASNFRMDIGSAQWTSTLAPGPPPVLESAVAYDSLNNRILMWGGSLNGGGYLTTLWQFSLGNNSWKMVPTAGTPPAGRKAHQMVVDAANHRVIIFGGDVLNLASGETWELSW